MGGDISDVKIGTKFYQETKKAVADGVLTEAEKQNLQKLAEETPSSGDDVLLEFMEDSRHVKALQQAMAGSQVPAYLDIPESDAATVRVKVLSAPEEAYEHGNAYLRAAEDAGSNKALEKQELEKALQAYQDAQKLDPKSSSTYHQIGLVLFRLGKLDEAIAHYRQALELGAGDVQPIVYSNLGLAFACQGKLEQARENLDKAAQRLPQHLDTRYMLAITLQKLGRTDEALTQFSKAVELDSDGQFTKNIARKLKTIADESYMQFKQAFDQPTDQKSRLAVTDRAIASYELLKQVAPKDALIDYNLGQLHYFRAMNSYTQDLIIGYDAPRRNYANDDVRGHLDKAVESFQEAIKTKPDLGEAHYFLGKIHNLRGEVQAATRTLAEAGEQLPGDADVYNEKAKNQIQQRQWQEAQQSYEKAIDLVKKQLEKKPGDPDLKKQLAQLLIDLSSVYYERAYAAAETYPEEFRKAADLNVEALKYDPQNELAKGNLKALSRLTLEGPLFEETSERYLGNKAASSFHAMSYYGGLAMAAEAPDAKPELKEHWAQLKQHIDGISDKTKLDFLPISYLTKPEQGSPKIYHIPLVGGMTGEGKYRIIDPLTNRYYEGTDKAEAMKNFLAENQYPAGRLRYTNDQGQIIERKISGPDHTADTVMQVWSGVALAALAVTIVVPNPVTGAIAASGLVPGAYFAGKGAFDIADRLQHGQKVTWDMWALEATQVVAVLLGVGALASTMGAGARAAGTAAAASGAAAATSEAVTGMSAAQRFVAMQRFLLAANIANDTVAAAAMTKQFMDIAGRKDIPDEQKMAAIFQTLGTIVLSTGLNYRNLQSLGGLKGLDRIAKLSDAEFQKFMNMPVEQRLNFLKAADEEFIKPTKSIETAVDEILKTKSLDEIQKSFTADEMNTMRYRLEKARRDGWYDGPIDDATIKRLILGERIYHQVYNPTGTSKPATVTQAEFSQQLGNYKEGMAISDGYWHRRYGKAGKPASGENLRRFYFNVLPDEAVKLADHVAAELNKRGIKFQYKMPEDLQQFNRSDAAVLYVDKADYKVVKEIVQEYARRNPATFAEGSPAFTKAINKGIAVASEPNQERLTFRPGGQSFGSSRADIIAKAILEAPAGSSPEKIKQIVNARLKEYGFDPARPWLNPGAADDF